MKPENQVITLETSKALSDAEIEFDSYWSWFFTTDESRIVESNSVIIEFWQGKYSAPTSTELLEWCNNNLKYGISIEISKDHSAVKYRFPSSYKIKQEWICHKSLVEALAQMVLWLNSEGHIKWKYCGKCNKKRLDFKHDYYCPKCLNDSQNERRRIEREKFPKYGTKAQIEKRKNEIHS